MTTATFQTFLTSAILLLLVSVLAVAWLLWRLRDDRRDGEASALEGVKFELEANLQGTLEELTHIVGGRAYRPGSLMEIQHPQLNAVINTVFSCDRRALGQLSVACDKLQTQKQYLRQALEAGRFCELEQKDLLHAIIDCAATLYLWDEHGAVPAYEAEKTRSWDARKWFKSIGRAQDVLLDLHLADAFIKVLRKQGMQLTPKPLTHTAFEYWSMRYDRSKDPRGVFGARRIVPPIVEDADEQDQVDADDAGEAQAAIEEIQDEPLEDDIPDHVSDIADEEGIEREDIEKTAS